MREHLRGDLNLGTPEVSPNQFITDLHFLSFINEKNSIPDHFMKLGTHYVNYQDKKKAKNTIEKKKIAVQVKN